MVDGLHISKFRLLTLIAVISGFLFFSCAKNGAFELPPNGAPDSVYEDFIRGEAPSDEAFAGLQAYAGKYIARGDFDQARGIYIENKPLFPGNQDVIDSIIGLFDDYSGESPVNIGQFVNSPGSEIFPVFSFDGDTLYFTGRNRADNSIGDNEDIFASGYDGLRYQMAKPLNGALASVESNEAINSISPDGRFILLFTNRVDPIGNNAFILRGSSAINEFPEPLNGKYFDSDAVFASDGTTMLFVSDRPGAVGDYRANGMPFRDGFLGNTDIYIARKIEGEWEKPANLGETINTPTAERTPYLIDDRTLVFASQGHYGLGGLDLFVAFRRGDGWEDWSEPINLGMEINSPRDDWGFTLSPGHESVYISSDLFGGYGGFDIYRLPIETIAEKLEPPPEPVVEEYISEPIITRNEQSPSESVPEPIIRFQMTDTFTVRFETEDTSILQKFYPRLDSVAIIMRQNPSLRLRIAGFADSRGPETYNLRISRERAESVALYLENHGVSRKRLTIEAHGERKPIADNTTERGRTLNRRAECRLNE